MITRSLPSARPTPACITLVLLLLASIVLPVSAQWKPTGGPVTRPVRDIEFFGDSVFAVDINLRNMHPDSSHWIAVGMSQNMFFGGIEPVGDTLLGFQLATAYISTDGGNYWPRIVDFPNIGLMTTVESLSSGIFFGGANGIARSTNNGATWSEANTGLANRSVLAFGEIGSVVVVGTQEGTYYSTTGGASWTRTVGTPERTAAFHSFATLDSVIIAASGAEVYRSLDSGKIWSLGGSGLPTGDTVNVVFAAGGMMFAGTDSNGVYVSGDHGLTWALSGLDTLGVTAFAEEGGTLFAGTETMGIFRSIDSGGTWEDARHGVGTGDRISDLVANGGVLFAASVFVPFVSHDEGEYWRPSQTVNDLTLKVVEPAPTGAYLLGSDADSSIVFESNGDEWDRLAVALVGRNATRLATHQNRIFVVNNGVFRYDTTAWVDVSPPSTPTALAREIASIDTFLFAASDQEVFRSSDLGATWTSASTNLPSPLDPIRMMANDSTLYLISGSYLFHSTDLGDTWIGSTGILRGIVGDMAFDDDTVYVSSSSTNGSTVVRSSDLGATWVNVSHGLERLNLTSDFLGLTILDESLYLATSRAGVWSRPLAEMSGGTTSVREPRLPEAFAAMVAPNPSSSTAVITVEPGTGSGLDIELYDALGRRVLSRRSDDGSRTVELDLRELPAGMYRCVVRSGDRSVVRSLVVVR